MPDQIERTIYKLELDDAGYIKGIESLSASTKKFTENQKAANDTLKTNEQALKSNSERLEKARKDLENYSGTNARYRKQLEGDVKSAERDQAKLTELVNNNRAAYEKATKAAQDFATTSARAGALQQQSGGGRIAPPIVPPIVPVIPHQLTDLPDILNASQDEFEQLRAVIAQVEARMAGLNQEDEEFKLLAPVVAQAKDVLKQYDEAAKQTTGTTQSLRTQLRLGREELVKLEQAGKANTKQYIELEKQVAKLTDEFGDQQARIRILASDTKLLDFGKGAITAATSAFQAYTSVAILAGNENEELQKKTMQLFAAMQLLQSLEQLSNLTRREGVLATLAQSGAQSVYTAVVGASTGALRTFRLALLGTGIGAAVIAIGFLVKRYMDLKEAAAQAAANQKLVKDISKEAADNIAADAAKLEVYKTKLNDLSLSQKDRVTVAKEYNKIADETNKIDTKQIDNLDLINQKIEAQNKLILQRALSTAALSKLTSESNKLIDAQIQLDAALQSANISEEQLNKRITAAINSEVDARNRQLTSLDNYSNSVQKNTTRNITALTKEEKALQLLLISRDTADRNLKEQERLLSRFITVPGLTTGGGGGGGAKTQIENVFIQERDKLNERLAQLRAKEATDEAKIIAQFQESLTKELNRLADLKKEGKLTAPQLKILDQKAIDANKLELDKALTDFRKKNSGCERKDQ